MQETLEMQPEQLSECEHIAINEKGEEVVTKRMKMSSEEVTVSKTENEKPKQNKKPHFIFKECQRYFMTLEVQRIKCWILIRT